MLPAVPGIHGPLRSIAVVALLFCSPALADCLRPEPGQTVKGGTYACIEVTAPNVTLDGVTVEDAPGTGILISASHATLRNVTVRRSASHGVHVICPGLYPCPETPPVGVMIFGGTFSENVGNGIKFDFCSGCSIAAARITANKNSGIQINFAPVPFEVIGNEIDHNGYDADGHRAHGIYTGGPGKIYRNRFHHNLGYGIHIWPCTSKDATPENPLDIRFNRLYRNGTGKKFGGGTVIGGECAGGVVIYWHNEESANGDEDQLPP